jgi:hypothetical protein
MHPQESFRGRPPLSGRTGGRAHRGRGGNVTVSEQSRKGSADSHDNEREQQMSSELTISTPRSPMIWRLIDARLIMLLITVFAVVSLNGCRTAPINDLNNQPVPPGRSAEQVSKAILGAGASLGWAMREVHPGMIKGTLYIRDHVAKVDIPYSSRSYSIRYAGSTNLKYDEAKHTIHSNYNGWVQNLDNQIRARLVSM